MDKIPFLKTPALNNQPPFDWEYGGLDTNIILKNEKLGVQLLRYLIITPEGVRKFDTFSIKEPLTNSVVVIRNQNQEIGLIHEWRPIPDKWFWACVRGFGDPADEDNLETAKREMLEEIGHFTTKQATKLGQVYQNTAFFENPIGIILLDVDTTFSHHELEEGIAELRFFDHREINEMIRTGDVDDLFTIAALAKLFLISE